MAGEKVKVEIAQDSIREIINAHVQTAVMKALKPHGEEFVRQLVEKSLLVESKDEAYRYQREEPKPTVLEHMVRTIIAEEAKAAIIEWAQSHREEIGEKIRKAMTTKKWGSKIAAQIAEQMATCEQYRFSVTVTPMAHD